MAQQEPIVFGVITPLSPPGETALGQLAKRGAEIGAEYINEKVACSAQVELSIHDSAGKNEQGSPPIAVVSSGRPSRVRFHPLGREHRRQQG
jgi:hypothetical protein